MPGFNLRSSSLFSKEDKSYNHDKLKVSEYFKNEDLQLIAQTPKTYPIEFINQSETIKVCFRNFGQNYFYCFCLKLKKNLSNKKVVD